MCFILKTKLVTPQFFCISDIGNSLSDCSQSMKKICIAEVFPRTSLKHASEEPRYTLNGIYIDRSARFKFQKLHESHNVENRTIKKTFQYKFTIKNVSFFSMDSYKVNSLSDVSCNCSCRFLFKTTVCSQRIISSLLVL